MNSYILGGCGAAILIVSAFGYFFYKQNQKLKEENQLNKVQIENYSGEISTLQKIFHHGSERY